MWDILFLGKSKLGIDVFILFILIACSIVALAIIAERFWQLQKGRVIPQHLVAQIWHWERKNQLDAERLKAIRTSSPLGKVLAAGLANRNAPREVMRESIEETGRHVVHDLERYMNTLATIGSISPLLGLLGTVFGMIEMFAKMEEGGGMFSNISGGIATALIATAGGLLVAIPSVMFYRYFRGRIDDLVVYMEQEAIKLVEVMHTKQYPDLPPPKGS